MGKLTQYGEDISNDTIQISTEKFKRMIKFRDLVNAVRYEGGSQGVEPIIVRLPPPEEKAYVSIERMEEMEKRWNRWIIEHDKIEPNFITPKAVVSQQQVSTDCYRSKRYLTDVNLKQDTNYFCACNIFQQIMYELYGLTISESVIASAMGTTTDGTSHNGIINGGKAIAQRYGHNVTIEFKNYSSLTEKQIGELISDPDVGLFFHDLYKNQWGHYEYIIGLCPSSGVYTVANSLSGGYIEQRNRETMKSYINGISQPSVGIVRKIS